MQKDGYSLLLPEGLSDYFAILQAEEKSGAIRISPEKKNNINTESGLVKYESKSLYFNILIHDLPVRGKPLLLDIRRRRWMNKETGKQLNGIFI
jgi:hypothetical protein